MVRVIDETPDPSVVRQVICRSCGVKLEYVPIDVKEHHGRDYTGGPDGRKWIVCPKCGSTQHKTSDSRQSGGCRLRTYTCLSCSHRYRTLEVQGAFQGMQGHGAYRVLQRELLHETPVDDLFAELKRRIDNK
jgi:DNA-directed RNA polymerase subunit RPC12/RpoP